MPLDQLLGLLHHPDPMVLLDTALPGEEDHRSYLFLRPHTVLQADRPSDLPPLLRRLDQLAGRAWIAGYLAYEAGYCLEPCLAPLLNRPRSGPLAWFAVSDRPHIFDHDSGTWNEPPPLAAGGETCRRHTDVRFTPSTSEALYHGQVAEIRRLIAAGQTYQVNLSFDGLVETPLAAGGCPTATNDLALYCQLRTEQRVPFAALIRHAGRMIQSFSPELFFRVHQQTSGRRIVVKPMKGTAARGRTGAEDRQACLALAADAKNRAENLMIVDLLRNDLGKICHTGTVQVQELFAVERHRSLLQMTSTITGSLRDAVQPSTMLRALFPSGSVTGAPKLRSMQLIAGLEQGQRGPYCGAIGLIAPTGDAVFSVPIRTLYRESGERAWHYRVGSGIVWQSTAAAEWQECRTKAAFLSGRSGSFELVETMRLERGTITLEPEHRQRLEATAERWDFPFAARSWQRLLDQVKQSHADQGPTMVRVLLNERGALRYEVTPIVAAAWGDQPAPVTVARRDAADDEPLLFHKTTYRPWYTAAMAEIRRGTIHDQLFVNRCDELCEGARSNLFVEMAEGEQLLTPPLSAGLLPGLLRARLLATGRCREQTLTVADLQGARRIYCGSSVRGLVRVRLIQG